MSGVIRTGYVRLLKLATSIGATMVGHAQAGVGALNRTLAARAADVFFATDFDTIQHAIDAAGATGTLIIPQSYAGSDSFTNTHEISILDLRKKPHSAGGSVGALGIYSLIETVGDNTFPMGNDLVMRAKGSADTYIEHLNIRCTTNQPLVVGVNDVTISAVTVGNATRGTVQTGDAYLFAEAGSMMVGRETANEEQINPPNIEILNANTIRITCTKTHAGTTDLEMIGSTLLSGWDLYIGSGLTKPTQNTTWDAPLRVKDLGGRIIAMIPGNTDGPFPYGAWQWECMQTGRFGVDKHLYYRHALPTSKVIWRSAADADIASIDNAGRMALSAGAGMGSSEIKKDGVIGELQVGGRVTAAITSTADALVSWMGTAPLNPSNTAGSLLLAARNLVNAEVVIACENTVAVRVAKNKFGVNGNAPVPKAVLNAAATDLATTTALVNQIRAALIAVGIAQ